jgi:hypothetical protein
VLSWDVPVRLHGESLAPPADARARGFLLRLHADPDCTFRLTPHVGLVAKEYDEARAETLCNACTADLVPESQSSVARRLREAERTLMALRERVGKEPLPREVVHCVALRYEATTATSVHPEVPLLAARVAALATGTADALRDSLAAFYARPSAASGR